MYYMWYNLVCRHPLKKCNVRRCSYVLTCSGGAPKWGLIFDRLQYSQSPRIPEMGGREIFSKCTRRLYRTYYSLEDMCNWKQNLATARNWPFCQILSHMRSGHPWVYRLYNLPIVNTKIKRSVDLCHHNFFLEAHKVRLVCLCSVDRWIRLISIGSWLRQTWRHL